MLNHKDFSELESYRDNKGDGPFKSNIINLFLNYEDDIMQGLKIIEKINNMDKEVNMLYDGIQNMKKVLGVNNG